MLLKSNDLIKQTTSVEALLATIGIVLILAYMKERNSRALSKRRLETMKKVTLPRNYRQRSPSRDTPAIALPSQSSSIKRRTPSTSREPDYDTSIRLATERVKAALSQSDVKGVVPDELYSFIRRYHPREFPSAEFLSVVTSDVREYYGYDWGHYMQHRHRRSWEGNRPIKNITTPRGRSPQPYSFISNPRTQARTSSAAIPVPSMPAPTMSASVTSKPAMPIPKMPEPANIIPMMPMPNISVPSMPVPTAPMPITHVSANQGSTVNPRLLNSLNPFVRLNSQPTDSPFHKISVTDPRPQTTWQPLPDADEISSGTPILTDSNTGRVLQFVPTLRLRPSANVVDPEHFELPIETHGLSSIGGAVHPDDLAASERLKAKLGDTENSQYICAIGHPDEFRIQAWHIIRKDFLPLDRLFHERIWGVMLEDCYHTTYNALNYIIQQRQNRDLEDDDVYRALSLLGCNMDHVSKDERDVEYMDSGRSPHEWSNEELEYWNALAQWREESVRDIGVRKLDNGLLATAYDDHINEMGWEPYGFRNKKRKHSESVSMPWEHAS